MSEYFKTWWPKIKPKAKSIKIPKEITSKKLNSRLLIKYLNNNNRPNKSAMRVQFEFKPITQINM